MIKEVNNQPYVYIWRQISTQKWYIGSRTAKGCHPNDGYKTSSKIVRPLIEGTPDDWERIIIFVGDTASVRKTESDILVEFNAKDHPDCFNLHNQVLPINAKRSNGMKGKVMSEEHKRKISIANKGKNHSPKTEESKNAWHEKRMKTIANRTDDEWLIIKQKMSQTHKEIWARRKGVSHDS